MGKNIIISKTTSLKVDSLKLKIYKEKLISLDLNLDNLHTDELVIKLLNYNIVFI